MARTHYWRRPEQLDAEAFAKASADCKLLLAGVDAPLSGMQCEGEPVFTADEIIFGGITGYACEPFIIRISEQPRHPGRPLLSYCKTENLPYDLCVKCALIILKHRLGGDISVMSDAEDDDWNDAKHLCLSCLGCGADFTLDTDE